MELSMFVFVLGALVEQKNKNGKKIFSYHRYILGLPPLTNVFMNVCFQLISKVFKVLKK